VNWTTLKQAGGLMLDAFREVVVVDTEFTTIAGERSEPVW